MATTASEHVPGLEHSLVALQEVRRRLAALDVAALTAAQRKELLEEVQHAAGALTAAQARVLAAVEANEEWRGAGDRSVTAWHGRTSGVGHREGRAQVRQARAVQEMPAVGDAVAGGSMSPAHLDALARATERAAKHVKETLAASEGQAELLTLARRTDADRFGKAVERIVAELDPAGLDRGFAEQRAARFLHLTDTSGGTRIKGLVDPVAGHQLRKALEALSPRPGEGDHRTAEQRAADALTAMAEAVLTDPGTASGAAVRPQVSFVMTEQAWLELKQRQAARTSGSVLQLEATAAEPVVLEDGTPLASSAVARMLCDCELTRVVVDAQSQPLDVGRSKRLYDGHLRRAVMVRDRTCSWPGCDMPSRWSEVHHIRWWDRDDGRTSVENGVLLCSFHHHCVHEGDLTISRHPVTPGATASNGIAEVRYEFRRPDGRVVAPQFGGAVREGPAPAAVPPQPGVLPPPGVPPPPGAPLPPAAAAAAPGAPPPPAAVAAAPPAGFPPPPPPPDCRQAPEQRGAVHAGARAHPESCGG